MKGMKIVYKSLLMMLVVLMFSMQATAKGANASLTVSYTHVGAQFEAYHVATANANGTYTMTEPFRSCPVDLNGAEASAAQAAALEGYVRVQNIPATASGTIPTGGAMTLSGLEEGLYLLLGAPITVQDKVYSTQPLLLRVTKENHLTVSPKPFQNPSDTEIVSRKILKVWNDVGKEEGRPSSITVYLLCDGVIFDSKTITAADNWRCRWDGLPANHVWSAAEAAVVGYTAAIEQAGITFVITNTPVPPGGGETPPGGGETPPGGGETPPGGEVTPPGGGVTPPGGGETPPGGEVTPPGGGVTPPGGEVTPPGGSTTPGGSTDPGSGPTDVPSQGSDTPTLPQTGLLWWPVPLLAFVGLVLFTAGWICSRREDDEA